jgi:hypothetical protein
MAFEHKLNTGSLWKNEKDPNSSNPDYKGKANVDGVVKDIAAWVNKTQPNNEGEVKTYLSIKFQEEWIAPEQPAQQKVVKAHIEPTDDLPF